MSKDQVGRHPFLMRRINNNRTDAIYATPCGSAVAYMDVGEGREQDAEASPVRIAARTPLPQ